VLGLALSGASAAGAEGNRLHATVDRPAVVIATPAAGSPRDTADQRPHVIVNVTGFQPAQDGPVQAVVKVERNGAEREIGRFGIVPHTAFKAADPSQAQSFGLPLPDDLAGSGPVKLNVYLVPSTGSGKGARLEVGGAEIR
jgi:hypothetical protein